MGILGRGGSSLEPVGGGDRPKIGVRYGANARWCTLAFILETVPLSAALLSVALPPFSLIPSSAPRLPSQPCLFQPASSPTFASPAHPTLTASPLLRVPVLSRAPPRRRPCSSRLPAAEWEEVRLCCPLSPLGWDPEENLIAHGTKA